MNSRKPYGLPMEGIVEFVGSGEFLDRVPAEKIKEYFGECSHNNWDGWEEHELHGIRQLMADMFIYIYQCDYNMRDPDSDEVVDPIKR